MENELFSQVLGIAFSLVEIVLSFFLTPSKLACFVVLQKSWWLSGDFAPIAFLLAEIDHAKLDDNKTHASCLFCSRNN